jgi:hypothetical protein
LRNKIYNPVNYDASPKKGLEAKSIAIDAALKKPAARHQWFTPIILASKETEIRGISVQGQPEQIV